MKQFTRTLQRYLSLAALGLALGLGACSDSAEVPLLGPGGEGPSESLSLGNDLKDLAKGELPTWTENRSNSAIIGPDGGAVYLDLHYLYVPRGAVRGPTRFVISLRSDFKIGVQLSATSVGSGGVLGEDNDVGSAGFKTPVYLTFSYQFASNKPAKPKSDIKVVEVLSNGQFDPQPTYVNTRFETATGTLRHFSDYGLAWPGRR